MIPSKRHRRTDDIAKKFRKTHGISDEIGQFQGMHVTWYKSDVARKVFTQSQQIQVKHHDMAVNDWHWSTKSEWIQKETFFLPWRCVSQHPSTGGLIQPPRNGWKQGEDQNNIQIISSPFHIHPQARRRVILRVLPPELRRSLEWGQCHLVLRFAFPKGWPEK